MDYKQEYLNYKKKYLGLKNKQVGGSMMRPSNLLHKIIPDINTNKKMINQTIIKYVQNNTDLLDIRIALYKYISSSDKTELYKSSSDKTELYNYLEQYKNKKIVINNKTINIYMYILKYIISWKLDLVVEIFNKYYESIKEITEIPENNIIEVLEVILLIILHAKKSNLDIYKTTKIDDIKDDFEKSSEEISLDTPFLELKLLDFEQKYNYKDNIDHIIETFSKKVSDFKHMLKDYLEQNSESIKNENIDMETYNKFLSSLTDI